MDKVKITLPIAKLRSIGDGVDKKKMFYITTDTVVMIPRINV